MPNDKPTYVFPQDTYQKGAAAPTRQGGMRLLEYFVGCALTGLLANPAHDESEEMVNKAISLARLAVEKLRP